MQLYLGNTTHQTRVFLYRLPEWPAFRALPLPPRGQAKFPEEWDDVTARDLLIKQIEAIGGVPHDDPRAIQKPRSLLYRFDKPLTTSMLDAGLEKEMEARQNVSGEQAERSGQTTYLNAHTLAPDKFERTSLEVVQAEGVSGKQVDFEVAVDKRGGRRVTEKKRQRS